MKQSALAALLLLVSAAAPGASQQSRLFFVSTTSPTASSEARSLDRAVENQLGKALTQKYPCVEQASDEMISEMLRVEKNKQLLGAGDDEALARIAGGMGSSHLVTVQVTPVGNNYGVTIVVLNTATARATYRVTEQLSGDDALLQAATMAQRAAQQISLPRCPETIDIVTITDRSGGSGNGPEAGITTALTLNMRCALNRQTDSEATCDVSYVSEMSATDGNKATERFQGKTTCTMIVDVGRRTTRLHVGMFRLQTTQQATLVIKDADGKVSGQSNSSEGQVELGGWEFEGPVTPGRAGSTSGSGSFGTMKATWTVKAPFGG